MMNPKTSNPPMVPSDEATEEQLKLARQQGEAFARAVEHMTQQEAHGAEIRAGDYLIGYAVEHAEGMYMLEAGELVWHNPTDENVHVEVVVRDGADGRFIPGLTVQGQRARHSPAALSLAPLALPLRPQLAGAGPGRVRAACPRRRPHLHASRQRKRPPLRLPHRGRVPQCQTRPRPKIELIAVLGTAPSTGRN